MLKLKHFFFTAILGGITVLLPISVLAFLLHWLFIQIIDLLSPLTNLIGERTDLNQILAYITSIALLLVICFALGVLIRTTIGSILFDNIEEYLLKKIPGYTIIKETIIQFVGTGKAPFSKVALVKIFGDHLATAFVTDEHEDGSYTVFIPTGPNPTSGNILHLKKEYVTIIDYPVDAAMRTVISCGAGSKSLLSAMRK